MINRMLGLFVFAACNFGVMADIVKRLVACRNSLRVIIWFFLPIIFISLTGISYITLHILAQLRRWAYFLIEYQIHTKNWIFMTASRRLFSQNSSKNRNFRSIINRLAYLTGLKSNIFPRRVCFHVVLIISYTATHMEQDSINNRLYPPYSSDSSKSVPTLPNRS